VRRSLPYLIIALLGAVYVWQRPTAETQPPVAPKPATPKAVASQPAQPTPPPQVSEHNWMKRSIDRASEVAQKVRTQTKENQDP
jgi:hypothetical protein